jgi:hypothetical protein
MISFLTFVQRTSETSEKDTSAGMKKRVSAVKTRTGSPSRARWLCREATSRCRTWCSPAGDQLLREFQFLGLRRRPRSCAPKRDGRVASGDPAAPHHDSAAAPAEAAHQVLRVAARTRRMSSIRGIFGSSFGPGSLTAESPRSSAGQARRGLAAVRAPWSSRPQHGRRGRPYPTPASPNRVPAHPGL